MYCHVGIQLAIHSTGEFLEDDNNWEWDWTQKNNIFSRANIFTVVTTAIIKVNRLRTMQRISQFHGRPSILDSKIWAERIGLPFQ